jgi:hypothetical protein
MDATNLQLQETNQKLGTVEQAIKRFPGLAPR